MAIVHEWPGVLHAFDLTIKVTIVLGLALIADRFSVHRSAAFRHLVLLSALLGTLFLAVASLFLPAYQVAVLPESWIESTNSPDANTSAFKLEDSTKQQNWNPKDLRANKDKTESSSELVKSGALASIAPSTEENVTRPTASTKLTAASQLTNSVAISTTDAAYAASMNSPTFIVWCVGFVTMLAPLFFGLWRNSYYRRHSKSLTDQGLLDWLDKQYQWLGLTRKVEIRVSDTNVMPMTWGVIRPVILIPNTGWNEWTRSQYEAVLVHELAHVKRLDVLAHLLSRVALSVYWFHPLAWYANRRLRIEREHACDNCVLLAGERPSEYAEKLVSIAREFHGGLWALAIPMAHQSGLEKRVRAVLDQAKPRAPLSRMMASTCLISAVCLASLLATMTFGFVKAQETAVLQTSNNDNQEVPSTIDVSNVAANELVGTVVDSDGQPVADATIDVWSWYPGDETKTDQQGRFRLMISDPDVRNSKVELRIMKEGYSPYYNHLQSIGKPNQTFVLGKKTYIEGIVTNIDGQPAANVEIRGEQSPKQADGVMIGFVVTQTKTDANGFYRLYLAPDTYKLLVRGDNGQVARLENISVVQEQSKQQNIQLQQGLKFEAKVLDSETKEPYEGLVLWHFMHPGVIGKSDAQGNLVIEGMFPGEFEFNVGEGEPQKIGPFTGYLPRTLGRWWSPEAKHEHQRQQIQPGQFQRNLDDLTFDISNEMEPVQIFVQPGAKFSGRVLDPNGTPVEGATVAPAKTGSGNSLTGDTRYSVKTDHEGRFESIMPAGMKFEYNLVAHDGDYQEWRNWANGIAGPFRSGPGDEIGNITIELTRPATVRGRVVAKNGEEVAGREVRAHAKDLLENRYYDPTTRVQEDGSFELRFIRPGEQYIQVEPFYLEAGQAPDTSTVIVELEPGETIDDIELSFTESSGFSQPMPRIGANLEYSIRLVDVEGKPIPDHDIVLSGIANQADFSLLRGDVADLQRNWTVAKVGGSWKKTNGSGTLQVSGEEIMAQFDAPVSVLALNPVKATGAIATLLPAVSSTKIELEMQPLVDFELEFNTAALVEDDPKLADTEVSYGIIYGGMYVLTQQTTDEKVTIMLPPGQYQLSAMHPASDPINQTFTVSGSAGDDGVKNTLAVNLAPKKLGKLIGKPSPELRGIQAWKDGKPTSLAALQGKVVLLHFWAFWNSQQMPALVKLHEEFENDGLEIIAIHDSSAGTFEQLTQQLAAQPQPLIINELPFRIAIAGNGNNVAQPMKSLAIEDYGVTELPTTVLISKEGKLVRQLDLTRLNEVKGAIRKLHDQEGE